MCDSKLFRKELIIIKVIEYKKHHMQLSLIDLYLQPQLLL